MRFQSLKYKMSAFLRHKTKYMLSFSFDNFLSISYHYYQDIGTTLTQINNVNARLNLTLYMLL